EVEIAEPGGDDPRLGIGRGKFAAPVLAFEESFVTAGSQLGQHSAQVTEVVRRRRMADPCALRDGPQGEPLDTMRREFLLGRLQQRRAQVSMMIVRSLQRDDPGCRSPMIGPRLDTV